MPLPSLALAAPKAALKTAHHASRLQFFVLGALMGTWGAHVPSLKAALGLSDGGLSLALLAAACGSVLCLLLAGRLVHRLGAAVCLRWGCGLGAAALAGLLHLPGLAWLLPVMVLLGAAMSIFDVAANAEGCELEARSPRKLMSGLHAMFSVGGAAGALGVAGLIRLGVPAALQLAALAGALAAASLWASRHMLLNQAGHADDTAGAGWAWPRGLLRTLGLLAALGLLAEGAMYDWSVVYLRDTLGSAPALAALGYASFSGAMAGARFLGDRLRERYAPAALLGASGWLAALAMAGVLWLGSPAAALLGFALVGLGLANVVPLLYIAASRLPGITPASGIAMVSSVSFLGFVSGPPLVGAIAQASSLRLGLVVVVLAAAALALGARTLQGQLAHAD
ncbi:MAG: MFS transporter [Vitreoscilla sp.]|nr:MFS transporter [Vitreoscilla sp.]